MKTWSAIVFVKRLLDDAVRHGNSMEEHEHIFTDWSTMGPFIEALPPHRGIVRIEIEEVERPLVSSA